MQRKDKKEQEKLSDTLRGTLLCLAADTLFGLSSFLLRGLTVYRVSADWTLMIKELIVALAAVGILFVCRQSNQLGQDRNQRESLAESSEFSEWRTCRQSLSGAWRRFLQKRLNGTTLSDIIAILAIAFFSETVGLRSLVTSYGEIGIVLANPIIRAFTIVGTILLGAIFLKESPGRRRWLSVFVLILAVFLLAAGQTERGVGLFGAVHWTRSFLVGFLFAALAGTGYAIYSVLMRQIFRSGRETARNGARNNDCRTKECESETKVEQKRSESVSVFFVTAIVCGYGSLSGGMLLLMRQGVSGIFGVPTIAWLFVALAGVTSFFAIWFKSLAFRYATAGKVAIFSVIQLILGAVLGIIFYNESSDWLIWTAVGMTIFGIGLSAKTQ